MKRLLTLCLMLATAHLIAQPDNLSIYRGPFTMGHSLLPAEQGNWLVGGSAGAFMGYPAFQPYLALIDAQGDVVWERFLNELPYVELGTVTGMAYDSILQVYYVTGYVSGCDYGLPGFLYQLSADGLVNWYVETPYYFSKHYLALRPGQGAVIAGEYPMLVQYYDSSGQLVQEAGLEDEYAFTPRGLAQAGNYTAVLCGERILLIEWNSGGWDVTAETSILGGYGIQYIPEDSTLIVLAEGKVLKLSANLELLDEADISSYGYFYRLACADGRCYALGANTSPPFVALTFDTALNGLYSFDVNGAYNHPMNLATRGGQLFITGNAVPDPQSVFHEGLAEFYSYRGSSLFLKSWGPNGSSGSSGMDVALSDASFGDFHANVQNAFCGFSNQYMDLQITNIKVRVSNNSALPLNQVQLNATFFPCSYICSTIQTINQSYNNLNLLPGASVTLFFPNIQTQPLPYANSTNLCIWASGPNGKLDDHFEDNEACLNFTINGSEEAGPALPEPAIFPNPVSETLNVRFGQELPAGARLYVTNALGQEISGQLMDKPVSEWQLGMGHAPSGLYLLAIELGNQKVTRRFVKQ